MKVHVSNKIYTFMEINRQEKEAMQLKVFRKKVNLPGML